MPLISVIIPTHNRAASLPRALDSVAQQSFTDWELIVVDDGSTDSTDAAVEEWRSRHPAWLSFGSIKTSQRGVSAARNLGAAQARGRWLAFLDSDDEWLPKKLEQQLPLLADFKWVHGEEIWIRNGVRVNPMKKHAKSGGRIFSRCVELCCVSPSAALVERSLFLDLGGFREDFVVCEDYELWLRLSELYPIGFMPEPVLVKYGGHADQLSRRYHTMDDFRCRALLPFLESQSLCFEERLVVARTLVSKCDVLTAGYEKHGHAEKLDEVRGWRKMAVTLLNGRE